MAKSHSVSLHCELNMHTSTLCLKRQGVPFILCDEDMHSAYLLSKDGWLEVTLLLLSCAKSHMLSASRRQPHLLHVSAVDRHQTWKSHASIVSKQLKISSNFFSAL